MCDRFLKVVWESGVPCSVHLYSDSSCRLILCAWVLCVPNCQFSHGLHQWCQLSVIVAVLTWFNVCHTLHTCRQDFPAPHTLLYRLHPCSKPHGMLSVIFDLRIDLKNVNVKNMKAVYFMQKASLQKQSKSIIFAWSVLWGCTTQVCFFLFHLIYNSLSNDLSVSLLSVERSKTLRMNLT